MSTYHDTRGYVTIACDGERHRIEVTPTGRLVLHDHRRWAAERAMQAMRNEGRPMCFRVLKEWRDFFRRLLMPTTPLLFFVYEVELDNALQHALDEAWKIRAERAWRHRAPRTYLRQMARKGHP